MITLLWKEYVAGRDRLGVAGTSLGGGTGTMSRVPEGCIRSAETMVSSG
jgi:hypothetical protein